MKTSEGNQNNENRERFIYSAFAIFSRYSTIGVKCGAKAYYRLYADFMRSLKKLSYEEQEESNVSVIYDGIEAMLSMNFGDDKIFDEIYANAGFRQEGRVNWLENLLSAQR